MTGLQEDMMVPEATLSNPLTRLVIILADWVLNTRSRPCEAPLKPIVPHIEAKRKIPLPRIPCLGDAEMRRFQGDWPSEF
jgi:hypothetical protein